MDTLYNDVKILGCLSGTSIDGIDIGLLSLPELTLIGETFPFPKDIKESIVSMTQTPHQQLNDLCLLDLTIGEFTSDCIHTFLKKKSLSAENIIGIGSHGQTITHYQPIHEFPFSLQIGCPSTISAQTNITTVAHFRQRDIANGGIGAPLAPIFHKILFPSYDIAINIGGIANISILNNDSPIGFDTGPGNLLLDAWINHNQNLPFDRDGNWAQSGTTHPELLAKMIKDPFFNAPYPKSTGKEYFNLSWLTQFGIEELEAADIQSTLTELTALTLTKNLPPQPNSRSIILCGGGRKNTYLVNRLKELLPNDNLTLSDQVGIDGDFIESGLFAWLAYQTLTKNPIEMKTITGAKKPYISGAIYYQ